jgi:hypothetical protein
MSPSAHQFGGTLGVVVSAVGLDRPGPARPERSGKVRAGRLETVPKVFTVI